MLKYFDHKFCILVRKWILKTSYNIFNILERVPSTLHILLFSFLLFIKGSDFFMKKKIAKGFSPPIFTP